VLSALSISIVTAQTNVEVNAGLRGDTIREKQFGIFFEEINHAGDGGLYAELISNRSFEGEFNKTQYWNIYGTSVILISQIYFKNCFRYALFCCKSTILLSLFKYITLNLPL
jgi:hypothetical protein